jgi:putative PIN family toxin of toxin-antitoxin system
VSRVTCDTNVLASGFIGAPESSAPAFILDAWRDRLFVLVLSEHILTELARTFTSSYFRQRLTSEEAQANSALLAERAVITLLTANVHRAATHPEDDLVLSTAVSGRAEYLITGDRRLQRLQLYKEVRIVSPRDFAVLLRR